MSSTTAPTARAIAVEHNLSTDFLDRFDPSGYCPGFNLWAVTVKGSRYLMAADDAGGVGTRLFFRAGIDDARESVTVEPLGPNPDAAEWSRFRDLD